MKLIKTDTYV